MITVKKAYQFNEDELNTITEALEHLRNQRINVLTTVRACGIVVPNAPGQSDPLRDSFDINHIELLLKGIREGQ